MAQPLPKQEDTGNGIDAAAFRLEQAFRRLESVVAASRSGHQSLRSDNEKLNLLLNEADGEIGRLREAVYTVSERLDRTIGILEKEA